MQLYVFFLIQPTVAHSCFQISFKKKKMDKFISSSHQGCWEKCENLKENTDLVITVGKANEKVHLCLYFTL